MKRGDYTSRHICNGGGGGGGRGLGVFNFHPPPPWIRKVFFGGGGRGLGVIQDDKNKFGIDKVII